jgi:hypothetical protein
MTQKDKQQTGPKPDRVKINKGWEDAMADAPKKKRPEETLYGD